MKAMFYKDIENTLWFCFADDIKIRRIKIPFYKLNDKSIMDKVISKIDSAK